MSEGKDMNEQGRYMGSSLRELSSDGFFAKLGGMVDPALRLAHSGEILVTADLCELSGWRSFTPEDLRSVRQYFPEEFGRLSTAGSRGQYPSFGFVRGKNDAPLVLTLRDGEELLLLIGRKVLSGVNANAEWKTIFENFRGTTSRS